MEPKPWWRSKTIWANLVALAALVAEYFGVEPVSYSPDQVAFIMAILNIILRFATKKPIAPSVPVKEV